MVKNYKCPGCGASMVFEEGTDHMVCPYCGIKVSMEQISRGETTGKETGPKGTDGDETSGEETGPKGTDGDETSGENLGAEAEAETMGGHVRTFHCPNCGAEMMTDENTAATFCSFCGSPTLIEERLSGILKPKYLIPFQIDR